MVDLLIIGSGGAGLSAALKAKEENIDILVVSKTHPTFSQTCQAQGGINAVLDTTVNDSVDSYTKDTYKASHKLGKIQNIEYFCKNSKNTIDWLDKIGVPFSRNEDSSISQRKFGGTKAQRTCYSSDYTGLKILHTLYDQCLKENINFLNEHLLLKLIIENNIAKGAIFLDIVTGEIKQIEAKSIILATGGYAGIYHNHTTNSYYATGEGIAIALKAGVKLSNMEFVQFHPTSLEAKNILVSESARGEGGYLVDSQNNRFIEELKPRDEVARAIYKKKENNEQVYLDLRHLGKEKIEEVMPQERRLILDFMKLKMEEDLIPVTPSAHYSMGGILTDIKAQTNIKNLYACGECSQSGIHGANRLGGNSLQEIVLFGKVAGENAAKNSKNSSYEKIEKNHLEEELDHINQILNKKNEKDFYTLKEELGSFLFKNVGLFKEEKTLSEVLEYLKQKEKEFAKMGINDKEKTYNRNLADFLEFENMFLLSKIVTTCALERKESRGAHFRTDFKEEKEEFEKISTVKMQNFELIYSFEDIK